MEYLRDVSNEELDSYKLIEESDDNISSFVDSDNEFEIENKNKRKNDFSFLSESDEEIEENKSKDHINIGLKQGQSFVEIDDIIKYNKTNKIPREDGLMWQPNDLTNKNEAYNLEWRDSIIERQKILNQNPNYIFIREVSGALQNLSVSDAFVEDPLKMNIQRNNVDSLYMNSQILNLDKKKNSLSDKFAGINNGILNSNTYKSNLNDILKKLNSIMASYKNAFDNYYFLLSERILLYQKIRITSIAMTLLSDSSKSNPPSIKLFEVPNLKEQLDNLIYNLLSRPEDIINELEKCYEDYEDFHKSENLNTRQKNELLTSIETRLKNVILDIILATANNDNAPTNIDRYYLYLSGEDDKLNKANEDRESRKSTEIRTAREVFIDNIDQLLRYLNSQDVIIDTYELNIDTEAYYKTFGYLLEINIPKNVADGYQHRSIIDLSKSFNFLNDPGMNIDNLYTNDFRNQLDKIKNKPIKIHKNKVDDQYTKITSRAIDRLHLIGLRYKYILIEKIEKINKVLKLKTAEKIKIETELDNINNGIIDLKRTNFPYEHSKSYINQPFISGKLNVKDDINVAITAAFETVIIWVKWDFHLNGRNAIETKKLRDSLFEAMQFSPIFRNAYACLVAAEHAYQHDVNLKMYKTKGELRNSIEKKQLALDHIRNTFTYQYINKQHIFNYATNSNKRNKNIGNL